MLVTIDGPMIHQFIDDIDSFRRCTDDHFNELDANADGLLLRDDLGFGFSPPLASDHEPMETAENLVFDKFDLEKNGSIEKEKFRAMVTEILTSVAHEIGPMPVIVGIGVDSLLLKAYEGELARIERMLSKTDDRKLKLEGNKIEMMKKDLKKKKSKKLFGIGIGMCASNPMYLGED